jgi:hypothetical protein
MEKYPYREHQDTKKCAKCRKYGISEYFLDKSQKKL